MTTQLSVLQRSEKNCSNNVRLGDVVGMSAIYAYGFHNGINATEINLNGGGIGTSSMNFVTSGSDSFALTSSNAGDNQVIRFYYYASDSDESMTYQDATLNGQTKVNLTNNMYRIINAQCTSSSNPAGTIYLGLQSESYSGAPSNIYYSFDGPSGFSLSPIIYVPPNKKALVQKYQIYTNVNREASNSLILNLRQKKNGSTADKVLPIPVSMSISGESCLVIQASTTMYFTALRDNTVALSPTTHYLAFGCGCILVDDDVNTQIDNQ